MFTHPNRSSNARNAYSHARFARRASRPATGSLVPMEAFVAATFAAIRTAGEFVSAKSAEASGSETTRETATFLAVTEPESVTEEDRRNATMALDYVRGLDDRRTERSDFLDKVRGVAHEQSATRANVGLAVWIAKVWQDDMDRQVEQVLRPEPEARSLDCAAPRLVALFAKAIDAGLKRPKIRLTTEDVGDVAFSLAGAKSRNAGSIYVTDGGPYGSDVYFGRISPEGKFLPSKKCTDAVAEVIAALANDPVGTAKAHGKLTGNCCFCGRGLETRESVAVGYGPVCADRYGLEWGVKKASGVVEEDPQPEPDPSDPQGGRKASRPAPAPEEGPSRGSCSSPSDEGPKAELPDAPMPRIEGTPWAESVTVWLPAAGPGSEESPWTFHRQEDGRYLREWNEGLGETPPAPIPHDAVLAWGRLMRFLFVTDFAAPPRVAPATAERRDRLLTELNAAYATALAGS